MPSFVLLQSEETKQGKISNKLGQVKVRAQ